MIEPELHFDEARDRWIVDESFVFFVPNGGPFVVPPGYDTDLGSTPRLAWPLGFAPFQLGISAVVAHDYLYGSAGFGRVSRKATDDNFNRMMAECGVPFLRRRAAYWAVRAFGGSAWGSRLPS